jgi:membrane associated rhomboid family serine protease
VQSIVAEGTPDGKLASRDGTWGTGTARLHRPLSSLYAKRSVKSCGQYEHQLSLTNLVCKWWLPMPHAEGHHLRHRDQIFNAPSSVLAFLAGLALVHGLRSLLSEEQDAVLILSLAFIPARYGPIGSELPGAPLASVTSFVTHIFLHGDITHLMVNSAWLLVFGSVIARRVGTLRFLLFSLVCGAAGAVGFLCFNPGLGVPVIGASGAISGLMGGVMRFLFSALDYGDGRLLRERPWVIPRMSLRQMVRDRRAAAAIGAWILLNFLVSLGLGGLAAPGAVAWEAHLGGFVAGLLSFGLFDRPSVESR